MSVNSMFSISKDALIMNQYALTVVSDNISNMNVEGYQKQRVEEETIACNIPVKGSSGIVLTSLGARIANISTYANSYLEGQLRDATCDNAYYSELQDAANAIENLMNELDGSTGLNSAFTEFYSALNDMASNPTDLATRSVVVQKAQNITTKFNMYAKTLNAERKNQVGSSDNPDSVYNSVASTKVTAINNLLNSIADINTNIATMSNSSVIPSTLISNRSELLKELSSYIPVTVTENNVNNTCSVSYDGLTLISGSRQNYTFDIQATGDNNAPAKISLVDNDGNATDITNEIKGGSLGATLQLGISGSAELSYTNILNKLDTLASEFANAYNAIQTYVDSTESKAALSITIDSNGNKILKNAGIDGEGNLISTNSPIFETSDGSSSITAGNITINSNVLNNPYEIAAAIGTVDNATGNVENNLAVGDTQALLDMLALRNTTYASLNGNTFDSYITSLATNIGVQVSTVNSYLETADSTLNQLLETKTSLGGVNLDEELVDLIKYQRAYEASARIFNVASQLMETLVTLGQ